MKRKLTIHVGMTKTGSSSIQATLRNNHALLEAKGIKYLGIMFENAGFKLYDWQRACAWENFKALPKEILNEQLLHVLDHLNNELSPSITH